MHFQDLWAMPNNTIVCTVKGFGITALSGGDCEGDTVFCSMNSRLIHLIRTTAAAVAALPQERKRNLTFCEKHDQLHVSSHFLFACLQEAVEAAHPSEQRRISAQWRECPPPTSGALYILAGASAGARLL